MADEKTRRGAQTRYINQLKKIFNGSPRQAEAVILIKRAAFFLASLDELEHIIQKEGYVDVYKNGRNQSGTMASASLKAYKLSMDGLLATLKKLEDLAPSQEGADELKAFLNK